MTFQQAMFSLVKYCHPFSAQQSQYYGYAKTQKSKYIVKHRITVRKINQLNYGEGSQMGDGFFFLVNHDHEVMSTYY